MDLQRLRESVQHLLIERYLSICELVSVKA